MDVDVADRCFESFLDGAVPGRVQRRVRAALGVPVVPLREQRLVQATQLVRLERLALRFQRLLVLPWIRLVVSNTSSLSFVASVAEDGGARPALTKAAC